MPVPSGKPPEQNKVHRRVSWEEAAKMPGRATDTSPEAMQTAGHDLHRNLTRPEF